MAIANYKNPGVYVTQSTAPNVGAIASNALNIAFFGYTATVPTNNWQNTFLVSGTGNQTFTLTQSGSISNFSLTNNTTGYTYAGVSGSVVTSGYNYTLPATVSGQTTFTVSGIAANTWINSTYSYSTAIPGVLYTFNDFNSVQTLFGPAFSYIGGSPTVTSPCTLAAYLAFSNGAQVVSCMNIVAVSGGNEQEFINAIYSTQTAEGIDVIVPLKFDSTYGVSNGINGTLFYGLSNYLTAQANNGIYQRGFIGLDQTVGNGSTQSLLATCQAIDNNLNNTRMTLTAPQAMYYNPGMNSVTGSITGNVLINGYYLTAAVAGLFAGQGTVAIPITNKYVSGFTGIPNQISVADSNTLQSYGTTVARQDKYGNIKIRQGLTTNTQNWMTQEISINAIGDQLAKDLTNSLNNSGIIGSAITNATVQTLHSIVIGTLNNDQNSGLIQGYTTPTIQQDPSNPTRINVQFQYAPTLPLNYINVTFSVDTSTGFIQF